MKKRYHFTSISRTVRQTVAHCGRLGLAGLLGVAFTLSAQAQQRSAGLFTEDAGARQVAGRSQLAGGLRGSRALTLDVAGMRTALATAAPEARAGAQSLVLTLPLPGGTNGQFRILETSVMEPALAAKYPSIKTYTGVGLDDPSATVRLDLTPQGFHAQVLSAQTGDFYIDPTTRTDTQHYLSFWKRDMPGQSFTCDVQDTPSSGQRQAATGAGLRTSGTVLRTFRLALAATGEYTAYHGGTVAAGLAAMVTAVNRVTGVYERELDVRLVLVANNDQLVYTNATTDPYSNTAASTLLTENQANLTTVIGAANYDIGHVFSTGGGGVAGLGVVCRDTQKARGETGLGAPIGDAFYIDYVAHEMGHQFGGNHTFNSSLGSCSGGNRSANHAYEPGSGTTIMAYAGICGADDLQPHSDAYFHVESYEEIQTYLGTVTCGTSAATGNTPPTVLLPASGKVLPINTPFKLTASGSDADGDPLTYNWEEYDRGATAALTTVQVDGQSFPLFRSFSPSPSPTRYFPRLSDLLANTSTTSERLPTVTRPLTFRVTLRDEHNSAVGIVGGLNSSANVTLSSTKAAGPFVVSAPNTAVTWTGGSTQAVTWDVAGTDANGVNCATVNIRLSIDGGLTYPTILLAGTPNDGSQPIAVPSVATTTARIMVEAADNYFFDISNANFTITAPVACAAPTSVSVSSITTTSASVSFAASGSATSYVVTTLPASTTQTVTGTTATLTGLTPGTTYSVSVVSNCSAGTTSLSATATFTTTPPPACNPATNVAVNVTGSTAVVTFTPGSTATSYVVTTLPATTTQTVTGSPVTISGLVPGTSYTLNLVGTCTGGGTSTTTISFATAPTNDNCAAAVSLTPGATCTATTGTVSGATQSQVASSCSGGASATANDVWYSFVATNAAQIITATSDIDGVLELFSGTCGSLASLGCVDATASGSEVLTFTTLTPGTRYYVRYYPYTEDSAPVTGTFTICVTLPAAPIVAPANNECAGAVSLTSGLTCTPTAGTITGATQSLPASLCSGYTSSAARDVWYSFVATGPTHTVQTTGTFDGVLQAFSGTCGSLTSLGCTDAVGNSETLALTGLTANTRYYVRYYPYGSTVTTGTFTICVTGPVAPAVTSVSVRYQTGDLGQPTDNVVRPYLQLVNTGTTAVDYSQVTVRYWLTVENFSPLVPQIDWAQLGTNQVSARYVALTTPRQGAYGYLEYSFLAGAGSLAVGSNSGPILTSFHKQNWTSFDETDDYSYAATSAYAPNDHITVYLNGTLVNGTEPAAATPTTAVKVYAANQDTSPTTSAINVALQVGNVGNTPVNYSDLTVRYWFTPDGPESLVYPVDYAVLGASNFSLQTGLKGADTYAELRFASGLGTFYPMSNTGNIQFKIRKANYGALTQTNDYSFSGSSVLVEQPRITAYLNGQLVYGTEPTSTVATRDGASISATADNVLTGSPNPFTDQVQLRFTLARPEAYTLTVYDVQGRKLEELPGGTAQAGQEQQAVWHAERYAAGLYLVRLHTATSEQQLKFIKQ